MVWHKLQPIRMDLGHKPLVQLYSWERAQAEYQLKQQALFPKSFAQRNLSYVISHRTGEKWSVLEPHLWGMRPRLKGKSESFLLFCVALCYKIKVILKIVINFMWLFFHGKDMALGQEKRLFWHLKVWNSCTWNVVVRAAFLGEL